MRDVKRVSDLLSQNFVILRQYDTGERLKKDQFGYSSIHVILEVPEEWLKVPTISGLAGFVAEVQIRTLAQHIWAEVSHTLQYKREDNVPDPLVRDIHRLSALLETLFSPFEGS